MAGHQYGDMLCTDQAHSELDNDEEDEDEEDEEEDDDDDEEEEAEDDDFYDEEDSNIDEDFEGLSINEEREIMRYALASHDLQQYENQLRAQQQHQNQHHSAHGQQQYSCSSDTDNGCGENNTNSNSYDLGTCHNHHNSNSSGHSNASDSNPNLSIYNSTEKLIMDTSLFDTKMRLIGNGIVLLVSTFALLVLLPLYFQQMTTNGPRFNVFGATFLLSAAAALVFLVVTIALGVAIKWKVPFYKPPLPWTK